jgi:hypothetical protein
MCCELCGREEGAMCCELCGREEGAMCCELCGSEEGAMSCELCGSEEGAMCCELCGSAEGAMSCEVCGRVSTRGNYLLPRSLLLSSALISPPVFFSGFGRHASVPRLRFYTKLTQDN